MDYRFMGRTGLKVSELCMGTQTFGWGADETSAHALADQFVDAGGNFFDTSNIYNEGQSETILGKWIKRYGNRSHLVIATKVFFPAGENPNDTGLSRKHIFDQIENSLRRLQTDYVDLYQAHCWDSSTPIEETFQAFNDLVRAGKVRYIGVSNFTASQLVRVNALCERQGWARIDCLQPEYSLLVRSTEWELLPVCQQDGIGVIAIYKDGAAIEVRALDGEGRERQAWADALRRHPPAAVPMPSADAAAHDWPAIVSRLAARLGTRVPHAIAAVVVRAPGQAARPL